MTKYHIAMLAIAALCFGGCDSNPKLKYDGEFHAAIAKADRMVFIDDGFEAYGRDSKAKTLFVISKPDELKQFAEGLVFEKTQPLYNCPCNGYPRVDWYQGKERLAIASLQHGEAIRWKGFQADAKLTPESGQWLLKWLAEHKVDSVKMKLTPKVKK